MVKDVISYRLRSDIDEIPVSARPRSSIPSNTYRTKQAGPGVGSRPERSEAKNWLPANKQVSAKVACRML